jgi:outer membrane murein-binding lipoprotein Lpp
LAKASEQFRQSDVTTWAVVALVCGAMAVFGANVSALVPQGMLSGLHKSRLAGASIDQLRTDVVELNAETARLRRDNNTLVNRFSLQEEAGNDVTQRVGALEVSLPKLLEAIPDTAQIDLSAETASIDTSKVVTYEADGGTVAIRQQPMQLPTVPAQPLPEAVASTPKLFIPDGSAFGIAVGTNVTADNAVATWDDLSNKLGPLLIGLSPLLVDQQDSDKKRIIVGPISRMTEATALCKRLERISIACMPMPYGGAPLGF